MKELDKEITKTKIKVIGELSQIEVLTLSKKSKHNTVKTRERIRKETPQALTLMSKGEKREINKIPRTWKIPLKGG